MVKMMLALSVVSRRNAVRRQTTAPSGTAINRPSSNGMSESRRWMRVSAQALSRWLRR